MNKKQALIDLLISKKEYISSFMQGVDHTIQRYPVSYAQRRFLLLDALGLSSDAYHMTSTLRLYGDIDTTIFNSGFNYLSRRHAVLRTVFEKDGENYHQSIKDEALQCQYIDISKEQPKESLDKISASLIHDVYSKKFDLYNSPGAEFYLIKLREKEFIFIIKLHHIVCDGCSVDIILDDLVNYIRNGIEKPNLAYQYVDYAIQEMKNLKDKKTFDKVNYWINYLDQYKPTKLPVDFERPLLNNYSGLEFDQNLPKDVQSNLSKLAQESQSTIFQIFFSALFVLLYRYNAGRDLCMGTQVSLRHSKAFEGVVGPMINTLVIRQKFQNQCLFRNVVSEVKQSLLRGFENQDVPFEFLIEQLGIKPDLIDHPLFSVMVVDESSLNKKDEEEDKTFRIEEVEYETGTSKFDITISFRNSPKDMLLSVEYSTQLFCQGTIDTLMRNFVYLLRHLTLDVGVDATSLLPQYISNADAALCQKASQKTLTTLVELFHNSVEYQPENIAVDCNGRKLTYQQLEIETNYVANTLINLGVIPGDVVALSSHRSENIIIGILGILKAGGAYLPISPDNPIKRNLTMLTDANVKFLLSEATHPINNVADQQMKLHFDKLNRSTSQSPKVKVIPDSLAYILYTSGSTGTPKGVEITHANVASMIHATTQLIGQRQKQVWTLFHSYAFDFSVWEIFLPLSRGDEIIVVPQEFTYSADRFYQLLYNKQVTVLSQTPTAFYSLAHYAIEKPKLFLKYIIFGGEALDASLLRSWVEYYGIHSPALLNMYGITEITAHATCHQIQQKDIDGLRAIVGKPLKNTSIFIADENNNILPKTAYGEICIAGPSISRGYCNNLALTNKRFISFKIDEYSIRGYLTGDVGRFTDSNELEYHGRLDDQVSLKGFRIELKEIEGHLKGLDHIHNAAVLVNADKQLIAYLSVKENNLFSVKKIRSYLSSCLPEYMIPNFFVPIYTTLPMNENGKLDRQALLGMPIPRQEYDSIILPSNDTERKLLTIWKKLFKSESIGIQDGFFALGGDSITAIQAVVEAKKINFQLTVSQIYDKRTIEQIAKMIKTDLSYHENESIAYVPFSLMKVSERKLLSDTVEDAYPLTQLQQGMLYHSLYNFDTSIYHDIFSFEQNISFHEDKFRIALKKIIAANEILRTAVQISGDESLQIVYKSVKEPMAIEDLSHLTKHERERIITRWLENEKTTSFDLSCAPLLKIKIFLFSSQNFKFYICFHHMILDGWSLAKMLTDLFGVYYDSIQAGPKYELSIPNTKFANYVRLEHENINSSALKTFWQQYLSNADITKIEKTCLVFDKFHPNLQASIENEVVLSHKLNSSHHASLEVHVVDSFSNASMSLAKRLEVPVKTILLAVHLKVLSHITATQDITTVLTTNNRLEIESGDTMLGLFLATIPIRCEIANCQWEEYIKKLFNEEANVYKNRHYPLQSMINDLKCELDTDVVFNFVNFHVYNKIKSTVISNSSQSEFFEETNFPLTVNFSQDPSSGMVSLSLDYFSDHFSKSQMTYIAYCYRKVLDAVANHSDSLVNKVCFLPEHEYDKIVYNWNDSSAAKPVGPSLVHIIDDCSKLFSKQTALVDSYSELTYKELGQRSSCLSVYLVKSLASKRSINRKKYYSVGICIVRSIDYIIAVLAVLKAGASFVPIDPETPVERIQFIIKDAELPIILTQTECHSLLSENAQGDSVDYLLLDKFEYHSKNEHEKLPLEQNNPIAYILYTSGTTGNPKGVEVEHSELLSFLSDNSILNVDSKTVFGLVLNFVFDLSIFDIFYGLMRGAKLVILQKHQFLDPNILRENIYSHKINTIVMVTALFHQYSLLESSPLCLLKNIVFGGEKCDPILVKNFKKQNSKINLLNVYGPSEAIIFATKHVISNNDSIRESIIGKPLPGRKAYILASDGNPVAIGQLGELYLGGRGLAKGYRNLPDATKSNFIKNKFLKKCGNAKTERLYKTGDIVRWCEDGNIEYVGRVDHQIKFNGYRINTTEIEHILNTHADIKQTLILLKKMEQREQLVTYFISNNSNYIDTDVLRNYLKKSLPKYMVPRLFFQVTEFPLTANGKIDRERLCAMEYSQNETQFISHSDEVECAISNIWCDILEVERISLHDNFFDIGGNSLIAVRIISSIADTFDVPVRINMLFQFPTIFELAQSIKLLVKRHRIQDQENDTKLKVEIDV